MKPETRNVILAVLLSVLVLFGWEFFVALPQAQRAQQQQAQISEQQNGVDTGLAAPQQTAPNTTPETTTSPPAAVTFTDRQAAIDATPRIPIDTPALKGSINLVGGRVDDLQLKKYHETTDDSSPIITLLSPAGAPGGYYAEQGWAVPSGAATKAPNNTTLWELEGLETATLTPGTTINLVWDNGEGLIFHRSFAVDANYLFSVTQSVSNQSSASVDLIPYSRVVREGTPHVSNFFVQHEGPLGVLGSNNLMLLKYSDVVHDGHKDATSTGGWLGIGDKYWAAAVIAAPSTPISARFSYSKPETTDIYQMSFVNTNAITVAPDATAADTSYVFAGAKEESVIASYEGQYHFDRLEMLIDWGWFSFLTKPMFILLRWLNGIFGNFGVAVLTLTVLVKLVFFPLANRSYASMAAMRRVQPEMKSIQERFKEDRTAQQQAMMELYKKEKINPLSGCWPILIQIPVFFSLYTVIFISLDMRHAPFFGWIQDLAAQDPTNVFTLFGLLPIEDQLKALPFVGGLLHLGIWPLVMGVTMWVQMRLNPPPPDPTQALIFNWMPVVFTFMLGTFPAGLVIYWSWNNFLSICQQYFIMKRHGADVDLFGNILTSIGLRKAKPQT